MLVVAVAAVVVVAAELLVDVFGTAVELVGMEMLFNSATVELLSPAPNVKREPTERKINRCSRI